MLQRWLQESQAHHPWGQKFQKKESEGSGNSFGTLPYQLWNVNKFGPCADAAITGIMPPPLMELQVRYRLDAIWSDIVIGEINHSSMNRVC